MRDDSSEAVDLERAASSLCILRLPQLTNAEHWRRIVAWEPLGGRVQRDRRSEATLYRIKRIDISAGPFLARRIGHAGQLFRTLIADRPYGNSGYRCVDIAHFSKKNAMQTAKGVSAMPYSENAIGKTGTRFVVSASMALSGALFFLAFVFEDVSALTNTTFSDLP